eukprot:355535_1
MSISIRSCTVDNYTLQELLLTINEIALKCHCYFPTVITNIIGSFLPIQIDMSICATLNATQTQKLLGLQCSISGRYNSVFDRIYSSGFPKQIMQHYGHINIPLIKFNINNETVFINVGFCLERIAELNVYGTVMHINIKSNHKTMHISESPLLLLNEKHADLYRYNKLVKETMNKKHNITCTEYNIDKETPKWHVSYKPVETHSDNKIAMYFKELFPLHNFEEIHHLAESNNYQIKIQIDFQANK